MAKTQNNKGNFVSRLKAGCRSRAACAGLHTCMALGLRWMFVSGLLLASGLHFSARAADVLNTPAQAAAPVNVAFYYQNALPIDELQAFDIVVIDPARAKR